MIKNILISQPAPSNPKSPYFEMEEKYGVKFDFRPLIHVERLTPREFRAQKVDILAHTAVIFNSLQAIDHFFALCKELRVTIPEDMKYFFLSEKIALYIQKYIQYRKRKIFFPKVATWDNLLNLITKHKKETYLLPINEVHFKDLAPSLEEKKVNFHQCAFYRTVFTKLDKNKPFDYDMLVFFTPSGVNSLTENFPDFQQGDKLFGCFGNAAATTIKEKGYTLNLQAPTPDCPSITAAIDKFLKDLQEKEK